MVDVFANNSDIRKNAYVNWRIDSCDIASNFQVLARGFSDAALMLVTHTLIDNTDKKADGIILPLLFALDHSIELYIKAIIMQIDYIEAKTPVVSKTHDIRQLLGTMKSRIKSHEYTTKGLEKHLSYVTDYIDNLYIRIQGPRKPQVDFARYPIDINDSPHFYVASSDYVVIDLEKLLHVIKEIRFSLDSLYAQYEVERDCMLQCDFGEIHN